MINLNSIYQPTTAQPYISSKVHTVYAPCDQLKPFIKSFWGTVEPTTGMSSIENEPSLIVPDGCVDIIFTVNHSSGQVSCGYCGIFDRPTFASTIKFEKNISRFAIQFYFWSVHLFTSCPMRDSYGVFGDLYLYFCGWKEFFKDMLIFNQNIGDRIRLTQKFLLEKFSLRKYNHNLLNTIYLILYDKGIVPVKEMSSYITVNQRQLERLFIEYIGTSPKKISNLVRYQNVLNDLIYSNEFDVQDIVEKYKFTDQSHMLNEFKKYHSMTPKQARKFASVLR